MNISNKKLIIILILIVGFDLLTKVIALYLLPFQNHVNLIGEKVSFYLTYNMNSTGRQGEYFLRQENNKNISLVFASTITIFLIIYSLLINRTTIKRKYKWLIGIGIFVLSIIISEIVKRLFPNLTISNWTTSMFTKIVGISFYILILTKLSNKFLRLFIVIVISAGVGNFINHFYYPFRIIDFIDIDGTYELFKIGVFNIADFAFDVGICGFLITLATITIMKIIDKIKNYAS